MVPPARMPPLPPSPPPLNHRAGSHASSCRRRNQCRRPRWRCRSSPKPPCPRGLRPTSLRFDPMSLRQHKRRGRQQRQGRQRTILRQGRQQTILRVIRPESCRRKQPQSREDLRASQNRVTSNWRLLVKTVAPTDVWPAMRSQRCLRRQLSKASTYRSQCRPRFSDPCASEHMASAGEASVERRAQQNVFLTTPAAHDIPW